VLIIINSMKSHSHLSISKHIYSNMNKISGPGRLFDQVGQEHAQRRPVGDHHQRDDHDHIKGNHRPGNIQDIALPHPGPDEETSADWRRQKADTEVGNHHDPEMNRIDSQRKGDGHENGGENQHGRRHIHEHTDSQQGEIDDQENDQRVGREVKQKGADLCGHLFLSQQATHGITAGNQKENDGSGAGGPQGNFKQISSV
jgi:hypothetical protein